MTVKAKSLFRVAFLRDAALHRYRMQRGRLATGVLVGEMNDVVTRALAHPPVDTRYMFGRWHIDRATTRGIRTEARVWLSCILRPQNADVCKFLIISRARSGSTLLTQVLNSHPEVRCGRELLSKRVLRPEKFLHNLAVKSPTRAYGAKLLSYQMVQVQKFREPIAFLARLHARGFHLIHLERDTFAQTLSLAIAQANNVFHQTNGVADGKKSWARAATHRQNTPVLIDVDDFLRRLEWNTLLLEYEKHCMSELPHLHISYEDHLRDPRHHQATADLIFERIGLTTAPVSAGLKKILPQDASAVIDNYDVVTAAMRHNGFAHLVPTQ